MIGVGMSVCHFEYQWHYLLTLGCSVSPLAGESCKAAVAVCRNLFSVLAMQDYIQVIYVSKEGHQRKGKLTVT
jgi:hypothetical protein